MHAGFIKFGTSHGELGPSPINPEWILEGNPVARNRFLSRSVDGTGSAYIWDCTAGRFKWHYAVDESICVLQGSVLIKDPSGASRLLEVGDTAFFPAGSSAEWTVHGYIRKIAFLHRPMPAPVVMAKRAYIAVRQLIRNAGGKRKGNAMSPTMM